MSQVSGEDLLLELVVDNFAFISRSFDRSELTSADRVTNGSTADSLVAVQDSVNDSDSRLDHHLVDHFRIAISLKLALRVNVGKSSHHSCSLYSVLVESHVAIVDVVVAELLANISDFDAIEGLMSLKIADRDDERLNAVVFTKGDAAGKDHGIVGLPCKVSRPELSGLERGSMNDELLSVLIERSSCLKGGDVGSVTKLCLGISADHLPVVALLAEFSNLLRTAKHVDTSGEHNHVIGHWVSTSEAVMPVEEGARLGRVVSDQMTVLIVVHDDSKAIPPLSELFKSRLLVKVKLRLDLGVFLDQLSDEFHFVSLLFIENLAVGFVFVEVAFLTLFDQVWVDDIAFDTSAHLLGVEWLVQKLSRVRGLFAYHYIRFF